MQENYSTNAEITEADVPNLLALLGFPVAFPFFEESVELGREIGFLSKSGTVCSFRDTERVREAPQRVPSC